MTHRFFTKTWHSVALVAFVAMSLVAFGCGTKNDSSSITNPNPDNLNPTGSIQGRLVDSTTSEPIVGAVVDIGVATATTNSNGVFTIMNVPATSNAVGEPGGEYVGAIDLRNVTSPIRMADPAFTGFKYPPTVTFHQEVVFSSFEDTQGGGAPGSGSGSNHDTPITGLVASMDMSIGKLASNLNVLVVKGRVYEGGGYCVPALPITPVGAGTQVNLLWHGAFVESKITGVDSRVSFTRLMSHDWYLVSAFDIAKTVWGDERYFTPADNQTLFTLAEAEFGSDFLTGPPVAVCSTDNRQPAVTSTFPGKGADIPDNTVLGFLINFSEPINNTTAYATALTPGAASVAGLWKDVIVSFDGVKAGNIVHSMKWNSNTQLEITFPTLSPSSKYSVTLNCNALEKLRDLVGNQVNSDDCPLEFKFTTNTGGSALAPTNVEVVNRATINFNIATVTLDWPPAPGAFAYNIYRARVLRLGGYSGPEAPGSYEKIVTATTLSQYTDVAFGGNPFVDGQNQVLYRYRVVSLNSDLNESATSLPATASDTVKPKLENFTYNANPGDLFRTDYSNNDNKLTLFFNEPVDEISAEVPGNYSVLGYNGTTAIATTPTAAFLNTNLTSVTLTLASAIDNNLGDLLPGGTRGTPKFRADVWPHVKAGPDNTCNLVTIVAVFPNVDLFQPGAPYAATDPVYQRVCVTLDNASNQGISALTPDDVRSTDNTVILAGANGVCNSTAVAPDKQTGAVGSVSPEFLCATSGPDLDLDSVQSNSPATRLLDVWVYPTVVTVTGPVKDIAGNDINTTGDQIGTDGDAR